MAPVTRRSQASGNGSGATIKKATRKRAPPTTRKEPGWNFVNTNNDQVHESVEDDDDEEDDMMAIEGHAGVEEAVNPLRAMADKVGREVERFAITVDQFLSGLPTREDKHRAAMEVVTEFKTIAEDAVRNLQKNHQQERMQQLRKEWSQQAQLSTASNTTRPLGSSGMGILSARKAEEVKELRHWQQEADIWELFRLVLQLHYRKDMEVLNRELHQEREEKLARLEEPHRYTTEAELYDRFLIENDIARERSLIKKWLERAVDHQESDLPSIMEELEARSGSGKGLWSHGWMNTREKIKGEKRLRTWPSPSDSVQPQIRTSAGNELLVTTLDPDAPSRQQRALEKPDSFYEKAVWIACWEMLRRGTPWERVQAWCEERNEGWRAIALHAVDAKESLSNAAWRKMCYIASESGCSNDYEAAVYGLLGGNASAVEKICHTVDDHLYAYYSSLLTRQFELYLQKNHSDRVSLIPSRGAVDEALEDTDKAQGEFSRLVMKLRNGSVKEESVKPMKIIQSFLLNNDAESLIYSVGMAASDLDTIRGGEQNVILRLRRPPTTVAPEGEVLANNHALRIAAHIYVIIRAIDMEQQPAESLNAEENVLVSYIQALRVAGMRDHTPVYASQMARSRYIITMSRVLQDVTQPDEMSELLALMQNEYGMDVVYIFLEQLEFTLFDRLGDALPVRQPLRILEDCEISQLHPGQRIMDDFLPDTMDENDATLVRSLQWFELLGGHWKVTFESLALGLRKALVTGRFGCALEIVRNFPFESTSMLKSQQAIGRSINVMDKNLPWHPEDSEDAIHLELLRRQSRTYYELEQLVHAVVALSEWVGHERSYTTQPKAAGPAPAALRHAKAEMDEAVAPLLAGILSHPVDDREDADLKHIRKTYIPEIIIAYNTALYTAGPTLSRDSYIEAMDLSVAIADEKNGLAECFVVAGRMRELVSSFAQTSKLMLVMKANGRPRKANKEGKELGLWEIGPQGQGAIAETDVDVS
ncbi:hypothetical protein LTR36_000918 [Oleoguttula mirabilis]|uniref:Nuclear pore complex protein n=1 Tax=Oleoguttula mirabilis TaxID=1507867 RepID=A0AAV9JPG4_9PEZI|nr:hypothetical protein LTR36_000918 [Oleoguttula mirabilis]